MLANAPTGQSGMEMNVVAMEFNGLYRHTSVRQAIGAQNLDFAPPPKGPGGRSGRRRRKRLVDAQHEQGQGRRLGALHWTYTKEGQQSPR